MKRALSKDRDGNQNDGMVKKFPEQYDAERVAAQKRLAQQLMVQMPKDRREQRQVLRFIAELIDWQDDHGDGKSPPSKNE